jgi:uncharacterized protein YndB with AHSA1/START domain
MTLTTTIPAIERTLVLRASPERVWRALTDADELSRWFGQRADLRPEVGYDGWMEWDGHGRYAMRVEEADAPRRLALRWMNAPDVPLDPAGSTLVEWDLEPTEGGGTRLHLRESGFTSPEGRAGNAVGWLSETAELVALLATEPWEAGIRRTYHFRSSRDRVWQAFADPDQFDAWWGAGDRTELRAGASGWWDWPTEGRYAYRIEVVEPPTYFAWSWTTAPDIALDDATELLRTEWALEAREDGGTDVHLLETGFTGPDNHRQNSGGWDSDVSPALRRALGEAPTD